jgi:geranylgeranyl transferase type-1 subunit beta
MQNNVDKDKENSDYELKKYLDMEKFISNLKLQNNQEGNDRNAFFDNIDQTDISFNKESHIKFLKYCFYSLKTYHSMESHKITILYFIIGGLTILKSLTDEEKELSCRFVLYNAIINDDNNVIGFRGGNFTGWSFNPNYKFNEEDIPHIAATYCALAILKICGYDNLQKIEKKLQEILSKHNVYFKEEPLIKEILNSQDENGSIRAQKFDTEKDVRFFYCAMCIFKFLGKSSEEIKSIINFEKSEKFLKSIRNYEGGFSMIDEGESNAGLTFCAIASYKILNIEIPNLEILLFWLNQRNSVLGVNGRTNKIPDTCYSFWVMGSLSNLDYLNKGDLLKLFDSSHVIDFIMNCQTQKVKLLNLLNIKF